MDQNVEYNFSYKGPAVAGGPPPAPPSFGDMAAPLQTLVGGGTATMRPDNELDSSLRRDGKSCHDCKSPLGPSRESPDVAAQQLQRNSSNICIINGL